MSLTRADFVAGLGNPSIGVGSDLTVSYPFMVSLLDGRVNVTGGNLSDRFLEVGAGGKATVESGAGDDKLFVWHQKTVDFDGGKGIDTILFTSNYGDPYPTGYKQQLVIDLGKGKGDNPYGGTLKLHHVENVVGTSQADKITGDDHANVIGDGAFDVGADIIKAKGGNDVVKLAPLSLGGIHADGGKGVDELQFCVDLRTTAEGTAVLDLERADNNTGTLAGGASSRISEKFDGIRQRRLRASCRFAGGSRRRRDGGAPAAQGSTGPAGIAEQGPARRPRQRRRRPARWQGRQRPAQRAARQGHLRLRHGAERRHPTSTRSLTSRATASSSTSTYFAGVGTAGALAASRFHEGTAATNGSEHIIYDEATGKLYYDADGNGSTPQVQFRALLSNHAHLTNADFVVA